MRVEVQKDTYAVLEEALDDRGVHHLLLVHLTDLGFHNVYRKSLDYTDTGDP